MFLVYVWKEYLHNFKLSLAFGMLMVFVFLFLQFNNVTISSGSIFFLYGSPANNWLILGAEIIAMLLFLAMYAVLVSLTVLAVRRNYSVVKIQYYLREMLQKFFLKLYSFYFFLTLFFVLFAYLSVYLGIPLLVTNVIMLLVSLLFLFVPQVVVIEEEKLRHAIFSNVEFTLSHPREFLTVLAISALLLWVIPYVEFVLDQYFLIGRFISLILIFIFVIPFIEILKTWLYMMKFDLIKSPTTLS